MRLTGICALVALVWLAAGTGAGLWAQAELFSPGLSVGTTGDATSAIIAKKAMFGDAILLHGILLQISLPLAACFALGHALLGAQRRWLAASLAAVIALALSAIVPGVLFVYLRQFTVGVAIGASPILIAVSLIGVVAAGMSASGGRIAVVMGGLAGALPLAIAGVMQAIIANARIEHALQDTYFNLARDHAAGLSLAFWSFAVLMAWAGRDRPARLIWLALPILAVALVSGVCLVLAEARLGLLGMPRRYIDYADFFFPLQRLASWAGFGLAFSFAAGAGLLLFLKFGPRPQASDAFS